MDYPFDLKSELSQVEFVLKTQRQLIKDFGLTGIDFPADFQSIPQDFDRLIFEISARLKELQSMNPTAFDQLLYRIDIPETILPDLARSDDFHSSLAEVVLKREAYKVFLRSKYST